MPQVCALRFSMSSFHQLSLDHWICCSCLWKCWIGCEMNGWFGLGWFGFGLGWVGFGFGLGWVGLVVLNECFRTTLAQHILSKLYSFSQHTHTHTQTTLCTSGKQLLRIQKQQYYKRVGYACDFIGWFGLFGCLCGWNGLERRFQTHVPRFWPPVHENLCSLGGRLM